MLLLLCNEIPQRKVGRIISNNSLLNDIIMHKNLERFGSLYADSKLKIMRMNNPGYKAVCYVVTSKSISL